MLGKIHLPQRKDWNRNLSAGGCALELLRVMLEIAVREWMVMPIAPNPDREREENYQGSASGDSGSGFGCREDPNGCREKRQHRGVVVAGATAGNFHQFPLLVMGCKSGNGLFH